MGISDGAQLPGRRQHFEAVGIDRRSSTEYFTGAASRIADRPSVIAREALDVTRGFEPPSPARSNSISGGEHPLARDGRGAPLEPEDGRQAAARGPRGRTAKSYAEYAHLDQRPKPLDR